MNRRNLVRAFGIVIGLAVAPACVIHTTPTGQYASTVQAPTGVGPASLQIYNGSNEAVYYIHMSPTAQSTWGPDLLGSAVLQIGQTFTISNISPGQWDLRVVDQSQNYKEWRGAVFEAGGVYNVQVGSDGWTR